MRYQIIADGNQYEFLMESNSEELYEVYRFESHWNYDKQAEELHCIWMNTVVDQREGERLISSFIKEILENELEELENYLDEDEWEQYKEQYNKELKVAYEICNYTDIDDEDAWIE